MAIPPSPYGTYPSPPPYGGGYGAPPPRSTNGMAIASLVCAFVFAPLAILFGHISLSQIKRSGQDGHGLAIAGLVLGYAFTVLGAIVIVVAIVWTVAVFQAVDQRFRDRYYPTDDPYATAFPTGPAEPLPTFTPPATLGGNCQYPATTEPASKPVTPPQTGRISTTPRDRRRHDRHQRRRHRTTARQRQGAVHGEQLHQPRQAALLRRHAVPPADHVGRTRGAAVR